MNLSSQTGKPAGNDRDNSPPKTSGNHNIISQRLKNSSHRTCFKSRIKFGILYFQCVKSNIFNILHSSINYNSLNVYNLRKR